MKSILITGANGFVGQHLVRAIQTSGLRIIAVGKGQPHPQLTALVTAFFSSDLTDAAAVKRLPLKEIDVVINLAGIARTNTSATEAGEVLRINTEVHRQLYRSLLEHQSKARIIAVSSGAVYDFSQPIPFTELSGLLPDNESTNPYARSKLQVEKIAKEYRDQGLDIIVVRPFNHSGPGQSSGFFIPDQRLKLLKAIKQHKHLDLGKSLDFWRDFTDVRDVVQAYLLLVTRPRSELHSEVYNIASCTSVYGEEIFRILAKAIGYSDWQSAVLAKSSSSPRIAGSFQCIGRDTGWRPRIPLAQTINDFVESS